MIDRYFLPEFEQLWSLEYKYRVWLQVELVVCEVSEMAGIVPSGTARRIKQRLQGKGLETNPCPRRIDEIEKVTKHYVIAFLQHIEELVGLPDDTRWLHYGMTGSDLEDTALAMLLVEAIELIFNELDLLINNLVNQIIEHRHVLMMGRTHGISAEPVSFGLVLAGHLAELKRAKARLQLVKKEIAVGTISGAVGTYAHLPYCVENNVIARLGLVDHETVPTQVVARDRHANLLNTLALIAVAIERFATNFRNWQRTEISEVYEAYTSGRQGSSAMPHKHNPIGAENICGLARMVRSFVVPGLENVVLWHERDLSHTSVERMILPDSTSLTGFIAHRMAGIVKSMRPDVNAMYKNFELAGDRCFSQFILLALIRKGMDRREAYRIVQGAAYHSSDFKRTLAADPQIQKFLTHDEFVACFDYMRIIESASEIINRIVSM